MTLTFDLWPWKSIGFQMLFRTKYVPSLVKIRWRMLIRECSRGCYKKKWPGDLDLWHILLESLCKINVFAMVAVMMLKWNKSKWGRLLRLARNKGPRKSKKRSYDADDILYESFFFNFWPKTQSNIQKSKKWKMYVTFNICYTDRNV